MAAPDHETERLIDLLNDERARRAWAEKQLVAEKKKTKIWRQRAEDRAAELRRLRWRRSKARRRQGSSDESTGGAKPRAENGSPRKVGRGRPLFPTVLAAVCDAPDWVGALFDTIDLDSPDLIIEQVDLVVAGSDRALSSLGDWLALPGRPPLLITNGVTSDNWSGRLGPGDLTIGFTLEPASSMQLLPVIDPFLVPGVAANWSYLEGNESTEAVIEMAANGMALRLAEDAESKASEVVKELVGSPASDPAKQSTLVRLIARSRYGLYASAGRLSEHVRLPLPDQKPTVGLLFVTNRPALLSSALDRMRGFRYPRVELIVGLHGDGFDLAGVESRLEGMADHLARIELMRYPEAMTLGECLNRAADASTAQILAKIDDDDFYGPWYLDEAVDVLEASGADLVGKATHAIIIEGRDELVLHRQGKENSQVAYVPGASFVMPRATWEQVRFAHRRSRVDSTFIRGLRASGMSIWSSSRFEFVIRRAQTGHTWQVSEELLSTEGEIIGRSSDWETMLLDHMRSDAREAPFDSAPRI